MGLGQTMLTAGLLVLMIMITISANRMLMDSSMTAYEAESINIAADLANSLIMEATRKKFDEGQANYGTLGVNAFTAAASFGPESGEALSVTGERRPFGPRRSAPREGQLEWGVLPQKQGVRQAGAR